MVKTQLLDLILYKETKVAKRNRGLSSEVVKVTGFFPSLRFGKGLGGGFTRKAPALLRCHFFMSPA